MQRQGSFAETEYASTKKQTRRDKFLAAMEAVVRWPRLVALPVVAMWIREPRPGEGERGGPMTTAANMPGLMVREVLATGRFWMLVAVFSLVGISINGTAAHVVP